MDIKKLVQQSEFFKGTSESSIQALSKIAFPKHIKKRNLLFMEGQKGHTVYLLAKGNIQLSKNSINGKEVVIKIISPGEIFGEVIMFEKDSYPVNAVAVQDSLLYLFPKHQLSCLFEKESFRNDFIRMLMKKQRYLAEKIFYLSAYDVEERLFKFLVEHYGKKEKYMIDFTKKDVALAIGAMPETMSRVLLRLKERGTMDWKNKTILLKNGFWEQENCS
jgi:CRP/FNR family transcriptional regulator